MPTNNMVSKQPDTLRDQAYIEEPNPVCERRDQPSGDVLAYAEQHCLSQDRRLTPIRRDLLQVLSRATGPLSAHSIAERLSKLQQRDITPIAAYRGLDFLSRVGLMIRLESKKAFVLCAHPGHANDCISLMCRTCGEVKEILDDRLSDLIEQGAMEEGFTTERRVIEIHGVCKGCQRDRAGPMERDQ